jgi:hypothetical protein
MDSVQNCDSYTNCNILVDEGATCVAKVYTAQGTPARCRRVQWYHQNLCNKMARDNGDFLPRYSSRSGTATDG